MSENQRRTPRKPATKFAHLQKKIEKQKIQRHNVQRQKVQVRKPRKK
jgi:hypothetical protein